MDRAEKLLSNRALSSTDVAPWCGFAEQSHSLEFSATASATRREKGGAEAACRCSARECALP